MFLHLVLGNIHASVTYSTATFDYIYNMKLTNWNTKIIQPMLATTLTIDASAHIFKGNAILSIYLYILLCFHF